jgi:hypothetical protein
MRHGPELTLSRFSRCTRAETGNAVTARYRCPFPETWFLVLRATSSAGRLSCTGRLSDNIRVVVCMEAAKWLHTAIVKFKSKTSYPNNCAGLCRVRNTYACWTLMIPCLRRFIKARFPPHSPSSTESNILAGLVVYSLYTR